jgi:hypothetical protein
MKITPKNFNLKIFALAALGLSTLLFAVAVFLPSTQPTVTIGQYALKSNDLTQGATTAYRPWYENGAWQGDVIEYEILADGTRRTDVDVGASPATPGGLGYCDRTGSGCWSARASFDAAETADPSYWQSRNIITNNAGQRAFTWDNLSTTQRTALDADTVSSITAAGDASLNDDPYISEILNYVRGERVHERSNIAPGVTDAYFRTRYNLLGDVTASPVYIGPPKELLGKLPGFIDFRTDNASRAERIAVPANDGMLHILDAADGSEVFAYVPSMVIGKLGMLAARDQTYQHTYYLAGELALGSAQIDDTWHTLLTGGGGPGFAGLFALDMTNPAFTNDKLLFEKSLSDGFGYIYGKPQIAPLGTRADPKWYIVSGNGYSTSSGHPTTLNFISMDDFNDVDTINVSSSSGGLSAPTLLSTDGDEIPDLAFAGDLNGDLWMFEIDPADPGLSPSPIKVFDGSSDQPISNAPTVAEHPSEKGYMVYFGTGSIFSNDDALNDGEDPANPGSFTRKQAVYGIWVDTSKYFSSDSTVAAAFKAGLPYDSSDLQAQTLAATSKQFVSGGPTQNVRIIPTEQTVNYRCPYPVTSCTLHKGWKVALPNCGERLIATPFVRAGRIQFVTSNPTGLNCGERALEGDSWVMSLDYVTGGDGDNTVVYNLNDDLVLDDSDSVSYTVSGNTVNKAPVGLGLGEGNISQPTFARLKFGTDKMFINGVILSFPAISNPGEILGGHIDVETDSPSNGVIASNNRNKHSEGYNIQLNDGLGGAVDGHVHDYDGIHNVDHVDLFELEPRRGLANLDASVVAPPAGGVCSTTDNEKGILVGTSCIQAIEGELNRAYDTLHTDADGASDPLNGPNDSNGMPTPINQSEVNALNAMAPPDYTTAVPAQKFIVVLANADLSTGGVLQIGCRTWPVVAYQTMITSQLASKAPSQLDDTVNGGSDNLVFTLDGIKNDGSGGVCTNIDDNYAIDHGLSKSPTLRIGFGQRTLYDEGIIPTRSQCVLGLHKPADKVCFTDQQILTAAEANLAAGADRFYSPGNSCNSFSGMSTPPADYVTDPAWNLHITPDGGGYRWRNGALTLQLLKVKSDGTADYTLQPASDLTSGSGTIAKAFTVGTVSKLVGKKTTTIPAFLPSKGTNESGMLYEANIYFHYAALVDGIRNSDPANNSTPPEGGCYGGSGYNGKTNIDLGGLNPAEYRKLVNPLQAQCASTPDGQTCGLDQYAALLQIIENPESDAQLNQALLDLANLLATNPELAEYVKYREYVSPKYNYGKDLLDIDRKQIEGGGSDTSTNEDGTPADVTTIETIDLEAKGPNFVYGRRNWIDIRQ